MFTHVRANSNTPNAPPTLMRVASYSGSSKSTLVAQWITSVTREAISPYSTDVIPRYGSMISPHTTNTQSAHPAGNDAKHGDAFRRSNRSSALPETPLFLIMT